VSNPTHRRAAIDRLARRPANLAAEHGHAEGLIDQLCTARRHPY